MEKGPNLPMSPEDYIKSSDIFKEYKRGISEPTPSLEAGINNLAIWKHLRSDPTFTPNHGEAQTYEELDENTQNRSHSAQRGIQQLVKEFPETQPEVVQKLIRRVNSLERFETPKSLIIDVTTWIAVPESITVIANTISGMGVAVLPILKGKEEKFAKKLVKRIKREERVRSRKEIIERIKSKFS